MLARPCRRSIRCDGYRVVLESIRFHRGAALRCDVEYLQIGNWGAGFSGHRVRVRFQRGPRVRERIDDPQFRTFALMLAHDGELLRVSRPNDGDGCHTGILVLYLIGLHAYLTGLILLLSLDFEPVLIVDATRVTKIIDAIGGELRFDDGRIVSLLQSLRVIGGVHHIQVVISGEDDGLVVGRDGCPARFARWPLLQQRKFVGCEIVLECQSFRLRGFSGARGGSAALLWIVWLRRLSRGRWFLFTGDDGIARHIDLELDGGFVLNELDSPEIQMLSLVWEAGGGSQQRRKFRRIKNERLGFLQRIDNVETPAVVVLVGIPEAVACVHPMRRYAGIEGSVACLLRSPPR